MKDRLEIYHRETEPIISFYAERGLLKAVDCTSDVEGTLQTILRALGV